MKSEQWRLLDIVYTTYMDFRISLNLGILKACQEGSVPNTVVILRTLKNSISASYYPDIEKDANLQFLNKRGVQIKRFPGGRGIGLISVGMLIVLYYVNINDSMIYCDIGELLGKTLSGLADTLGDRFGITSRFRPPNDVIVENRKFVLSSMTFEDQIANFCAMIQIKEQELDIIEKGLVISPEKMTDKGAKTHKEWITWLEKEIEREISFNEITDTCIKAIERTYKVKLIRGSLTEAEIEYAKKFFQKYDSHEWQFSRTEKVRFGKIEKGVKRKEYRLKVPGGSFLRAVVLIREGLDLIEDILITGAIQCKPIEIIDEIEDILKGSPIDEKVIRKKIEVIYAKPNVSIMGASIGDFVRLIMGAAVG